MLTCCSSLCSIKLRNLAVHSFIHSLHAFRSVDHRCVAADILWQPSNMPYLGISSTIWQ